MNAKFGILSFSLMIVTLSFGQSGFTTIGGANFIGYGRAGVNISGIESIYLNQAGLAEITNMAFDISTEKRFNLDELTNISIAGAKTFKFGTIGILASNFGYSEYNEQKFGLAYAKKLSTSISLGGQFDLLRYNVSQAGSKNIYTFEIGMQLKLNKDFSVATHIFSPGNISVTENTELGTRLRLGLKYSPSNKVFILAELDKVIYRPLEYKLGISYQVINELQLRFGMNPTVESFSFGAMVSFMDKYKITSAYSLNSRLGNFPALTLQYQD